MRIDLRNTFCVVILAGLAATAAAQTYPSRPITMLVPFAPGGAVDAAARFIGEPMSKLLGQPLVVEYRSGAAGNIGYGQVARSPADGYTVLVSYSAASACSPALYNNLTWDPIKDFAQIGMFVLSSLVITVHPSVPVTNLQEFIAYAKQNPEKINYGSSGIGSLAHIAGEMLAQKAGIKMTHVPFKGTGDLMPSLLSGSIQMSLQGPPAVKQLAQNGKLKAIAVTSTVRDPVVPNIPTANEAGLPGYEVEGWIGLMVRAGTPQPIIDRLAETLKVATENKEFREKASGLGLDIRHLGPQDTAARVRKDLDSCRTAIRNANIKLEQ